MTVDILDMGTLRAGDALVVEAARAGTVARCSGAHGTDASLRASVIAALCTDPSIDRRGLRIEGWRICGELDLSHASVNVPIELINCVFLDGYVRADQARLRHLSLRGTHVESPAPDGVAVDLHDAAVDGDVCLDGLRTSGRVTLAGATVGGQLSLRGASISRPDGLALDANGAEIKGGVDAGDGFQACGQLRMHNARIGGGVILSRAVVRSAGTTGLDMSNADVTGDVLLTDGFRCEGGVVLRSARVTGVVAIRMASLQGADGVALDADGLETRGDLLVYDCEVTGTTRLIAAEIGNCLEVRGGTLQADGGPALLADGVAATGVIRMDEGLRINGEVRLAAASMSQLVCRNVEVTNPGGLAFMARGINVRAEALMDRGVRVSGELQISDASIGTVLDLSGATLSNQGGVALQARGARIGTDLVLNAVHVTGDVELEAATAREFVLEGGSWSGARANVRGFTYSSVVPGPDQVTVEERLRWIRSSGAYVPGAFEVLANAYRNAGHESAAQRVRIAKQRDRRKGLRWHERVIDRVWDATLLYGYSSWRALAALAALLIATSLVFVTAQSGIGSGGMMYVGDQNPPPFSPVLYAVDLVIPIVDLRHASLWAATGWRAAVAGASTATGWVLTTAAAIGLSGILTRRD